MREPETSGDLNRRGFGLTIAAAALTVGTVETAMAEDAPEPPAAVVDRIVEIIRQEHPHERLDEAAIAEIRTDVEQHRIRSAVLSSFPLTNGDEPGALFRAFRQD